MPLAPHGIECCISLIWPTEAAGDTGSKTTSVSGGPPASHVNVNVGSPRTFSVDVRLVGPAGDSGSVYLSTAAIV